MISINTSQNNLILQRSLNSSSRGLATAMQRLSSGLKINNAGDDAAGLSLTNKLSSQIQGLSQAQKNAQDGIGLLNTADSSLKVMMDNIQRIRELSTQAANGVYSQSERQALEKEAQQLIDSIYQTKNSTKFNEIDIFGSPEVADAIPKTGTYRTTRITEEQAIAAGYTVIKTAEDFVSKIAQNGAGTNGQTYILMGNIDMSVISNYVPKTGFSGTLDGNGFAISNLTVNTPANNDVGLFGTMSNGTIKNLSVSNFNMSGWDRVGVLVGDAQANSTIQNCTVSSSSATGKYYIGGIAGVASGQIKNCSSNATVSGINFIGGIDGWNYATVSNTNSSGTITGSGEWAGGIAGVSDAGIYQSSSSCTISSTRCVGGLVGENRGGITESFATGNIKGGSWAGGLAGENNGGILNSYSKGNVSGNDSIGGLVGVNDRGNIVNSYCSSTMSGNSNIGGIIGANPNSLNLTHENNFFDSSTTGQSNGIGSGMPSDGITALDYEQMGNTTNYKEAGWSSNVWNFESETPKLRWQDPDITLQIGTKSTSSSRISIDTSFRIGDFSVDFSSADSARSGISRCDSLLAQITSKRADIGANINRMDSIISSQSTKTENLSAAKSIITDTDVAKESASLAKSKILKQATTSLMSTTMNIESSLILALVAKK